MTYREAKTHLKLPDTNKYPCGKYYGQQNNSTENKKKVTCKICKQLIATNKT